jgi:hypothetical protein
MDSDAGSPGGEEHDDDGAPTAVAVGEGEEVIDLTEEEREAIPARSDDQA